MILMRRTIAAIIITMVITPSKSEDKPSLIPKRLYWTNIAITAPAIAPAPITFPLMRLKNRQKANTINAPITAPEAALANMESTVSL